MKLPKLALRDFFWLVLVAAMGLGWWVQRDRLVAARDAAQKERVAAEAAKAGAEKVAKMYLKIVNAYRSDGRLHDVMRKDGTVYVTDREIRAGMQPATGPESNR